MTHIRRLALSIPAILSIVCHLIAHVLPKPQPARFNANTKKKQVDTTNVVAKCLISNQPLETVMSHIE